MFRYQIVCPVCLGKGSLTYTLDTTSTGSTAFETCSKCGGYGFIWNDGTPYLNEVAKKEKGGNINETGTV